VKKFLLQVIHDIIIGNLASNLRESDSEDFVKRTKKEHEITADKFCAGILVLLSDIE
jgi:hypothetical protein